MSRLHFHCVFHSGVFGAQISKKSAKVHLSAHNVHSLQDALKLYHSV